ncbi:MAG TPA: dockerin type I domain-containing protein [Clostridia bacterium]
MKTADLDVNGKVNSADYSILKRYILGTIQSLPVESK